MPISALNPLIPGDNDNAGEGANRIREIKQALIDCFGGVDALVEAGLGNGAATAAELTNLFDRLTTIEDKAARGAGIVGEVRLYHGVYGSWPAGWVHCNGTGGTPNMEDRFPYGSDSVAGMPTNNGTTFGGSIAGTGNTGGQTGITYAVGGHTLTLAELPAGLPGALLVQHDTGGDGIQHSNWGSAAGGETIGTAKPIITATGINGDPHTHPATGTLEHTHSLGAGAAPPWIAFYFIKFVGP